MKNRPAGAVVMRSQGATPRYTLMQSSYWASYCILLTFSSVYLLSKGFPNAQIGVILSLASVISALLQPVVSRIADGLKNISLYQFSAGLIVVQLAGSILLGVLPGQVPQAVIYGVLIVVLQLILPLCNALGMDCLNRGVPLNFGVARGGGSIAYGVFSSLCGIMVLRFGEQSLPLAMLAIHLVLFLSVATFRFRTVKQAEAPVEVAQEEKAAPAADQPKGTFLKRYKWFLPLLIGVVLLFLSHNVLNTYAYQIVQPLGGTSEQMGNMLFIQSIAELPVMFGFFLLLKKASSRVWVGLSGISFFLHALGEWLAPTIGVIYAVQIFEMPGYALFTIASVYFVNETVAERDRVQGQAYIAMAMTIGSVLASFAGGFLLDSLGVRLLLAFATVAGGVGMLLLFPFAGKKKQAASEQAAELA